MAISLALIYFILTIGHAVYHWYLIEKKNKTLTSKRKIYEWSLISFVTGVLLIHNHELLPLIILPIVTRLAHFDVALNIMRGKGWLYEGEISKRKSIWDYIENKIGLPIWFYRVFYYALYVGYLITFFYAN